MNVAKLEQEIEDALWNLETTGQEEAALQSYEETAAKLEWLLEEEGDRADVLCVYSYACLRRANLLRVLGNLAEAQSMGEKAIAAGRESGDDLVVARALLNHAGTLAVQRHPTLESVLGESLELFSCGESEDHIQGVGWHWLLVADMCDAELLPGDADMEIAAAKRALVALVPIENWQGIARAHRALERAYRKSGVMDEAEASAREARRAEERAHTEKR